MIYLTIGFVFIFCALTIGRVEMRRQELKAEIAEIRKQSESY